MREACRLIIDNILDGKISTKQELETAKRKACSDFKLDKFMKNSLILEYATSDEKKLVTPLLQKKPTKTISGVAIVAVMCHPHDCPHGRCFYCPESDKAPPSYTGEEPAALRARMYSFDPYQQTYNRLKQLNSIGHPLDKIELIIMGGTFPSKDLSYQEWFVSKCLQAMVDFGLELEDIDLSTNYPLKKFPPNDFIYLDDVQKVNETSKIRCIGMTFETRPDYCKIEHVDRILRMGGTRVELGVQTLRNDIYERVERGHTIEDVIEANQILRDSGLKVAMHIMPGLFQDFDEDLETFKKLFRDESFKPDMLKIYPCLVTQGSKLYTLWENGGYRPYTNEEAVDLIVEVKKILPKWVRTMRIQRDIPATLIEAGVTKSNLGELVYNRLDEENIQCQCIRCREIGHRAAAGTKINPDNIILTEQKYNAVNGEETFLSFEDDEQAILAGFLRLRMPSPKAHRPEVTNQTALIRELHVYGPMQQIGEHNISFGQHIGYGEQLLTRAEEIAKDNGKNKIMVTSGIGVREYYRKFGYEKEGPYMAKKI